VTVEPPTPSAHSTIPAALITPPPPPPPHPGPIPIHIDNDEDVHYGQDLLIQAAANLGFPTPEDMENGYNTYLGAHTMHAATCPPKLLG
jgi:hypothetical protein